MTDEQVRFARSDDGRDILERAQSKFDGFDPIGNVNFSQVFQAMEAGWIDGKGITPEGCSVYERFHG